MGRGLAAVTSEMGGLVTFAGTLTFGVVGEIPAAVAAGLGVSIGIGAAPKWVVTLLEVELGAALAAGAGVKGDASPVVKF